MKRDKEFEASLRLALATERESGSRVIECFHELDSTSSELLGRVRGGCAPGDVVATMRQTKGRGRSGKSWFAGGGRNVCLSLAVPVPDPVAEKLPMIPLAAGVAAATIVRSCGVDRARLKWPNDLLVDGRKIAGILCEVGDLGHRPLISVVGIGINVETNKFPFELSRISTSLALEGAGEVDVAGLSALWIQEMESRLSLVERGDMEPLISEWLHHAEPFGRRVRSGEVEGVTVRLKSDGRLVIRQDDGVHTSIVGGVIEYVQK